MTKFELYLLNKGIHFQTAGKYNGEVTHYLNWVNDNNLKPRQVKRSKFTEFLQYRRDIGDHERTINRKEGIIKHYYDFLGTKHNPAKVWLKKRKHLTLPPKAIEREQLIEIYHSLKPKSPAEYRNRCMLGFVLFQGMLRAELTELRISDVNFDGDVFIQGRRRSNQRTIKLEPFQVLHLYDYLHKYRKEFLCLKKEDTDRFFLSKGNGSKLENSLTLMMHLLKKQYPFIIDLRHLRGSVISHWDKQEGVIEAMTKAGHRYVSSTVRFQTNKLEELKDELKTLHPLENMILDC